MSAIGILAAAIGPGDSRRKLKPLCYVEGKDHRGRNPEYNHPLVKIKFVKTNANVHMEIVWQFLECMILK